MIDTRQGPVGPDGQYLMQNGVTRDVAIRIAQRIDHPARARSRGITFRQQSQLRDDAGEAAVGSA
jgi:hypothetical protein